MEKQRSDNDSATTECEHHSLDFSSGQWFRSLTELIPDLSVQGYTTDGTVVFWNAASEDIYGYSKEEAIGKNLGDLIIPDEIKPAFLQCLEIGKTLTQSGEFAPAGELVLLNKYGDSIPVYSIHTAICRPEQETILFCLDLDLSKRKQAESQLRELTRDLRDKNKYLKNIFQIAAHDLRTPMINVSGFSNEINKTLRHLEQIIGEIDIPAARSEDIKNILSREIPEYTRLITLGINKIGDLLDGLSKTARHDAAAAKVEPLEMDSILKRVLLDFEYECRDKSISLRADPLPNCIGDRFQIQCILTNLISNAVKFLDPARQGSIVISGKKCQNKSIYQIQDNGVGIPGESIENIFDYFYQLNPESQDGQGLGLSIVKNIIHQHGGQIWVESEPGKGSCFFFSIPASP